MKEYLKYLVFLINAKRKGYVFGSRYYTIWTNDRNIKSKYRCFGAFRLKECLQLYRKMTTIDPLKAPMNELFNGTYYIDHYENPRHNH